MALIGAKRDHHAVALDEGILVVTILFVIAGGGIIVLDTFILRRLRRNAAERGELAPKVEPKDQP